jgi:sigma-B regulation protein RsbU (phosphoserine phosphatase)
MRIARAGQPLPMIYRSSEKKASELDCPGVYPLGIEPFKIKIPVTEIKLMPGDRFLIYTDGLTERFDSDGQFYGEDRLLQALADDGAVAPQEIIAVIMGDVERFAGEHPADDDQALLLGVVE